MTILHFARVAVRKSTCLIISARSQLFNLARIVKTQGAITKKSNFEIQCVPRPTYIPRCRKAAYHSVQYYSDPATM